MKNTLPFSITLILSIFGSQPLFSQESRDFPTHCKSGEFAYLNAKMAKIEYYGTGNRRGYNLIKNGKILSLCTDEQQEPFGKMVYRYGAIGKVEMEKIATRSNPFWIFSRSTSPHTGENLIFFRVGEFNYYISEATGQGSGISLMVFKSGRKILDLFSGNQVGNDFQNNLIELNFDKPSSPIFIKKQPIDKVGFHSK